MPLTIQTTDGPVLISDHQTQAIIRLAHRHAERTAAALDATGLFPNRPVLLPGPFLLELAAVVELCMWERQGLRPYLATDLPTFQEAAA